MGTLLVALRGRHRRVAPVQGPRRRNSSEDCRAPCRRCLARSSFHQCGWSTFGQLCRYISALSGSMSLAKMTSQPCRSSASRTKPIPAKNSAAVKGRPFPVPTRSTDAKEPSRRSCACVRADIRLDCLVQTVEQNLDIAVAPVRSFAGRSDAIGRKEVVVLSHVEVAIANVPWRNHQEARLLVGCIAVHRYQPPCSNAAEPATAIISPLNGTDKDWKRHSDQSRRPEAVHPARRGMKESSLQRGMPLPSNAPFP
jgi:hypothetical protein